MQVTTFLLGSTIRRNLELRLQDLRHVVARSAGNQKPTRRKNKLHTDDKNFDLLKRRAAAGDLSSQIDLAWIYVRGDMGTVDLNAAQELFENARKQNVLIAEFNYGRFLHYIGKPEGIALLRYCAHKGLSTAQFHYAQKLFSRGGNYNKLKAFVFYKKAVAQGDVLADFVYHARLVNYGPILNRPCHLVLAIRKFIVAVRMTMAHPGALSF